MSTQTPNDQTSNDQTPNDRTADDHAAEITDITSGLVGQATSAETGAEEAEAQAFFQALATSIGFLPQNGVADDGEPLPEGAIAIPVIEQDGTQYVPVFTSEEALRAAGADPEPAVGLPIAELAANWPSEDLWLAVNPGSEDGLTLPPDAVQALATFAQG